MHFFAKQHFFSTQTVRILFLAKKPETRNVAWTSGLLWISFSEGNLSYDYFLSLFFITTTCLMSKTPKSTVMVKSSTTSLIVVRQFFINIIFQLFIINIFSTSCEESLLLINVFSRKQKIFWWFPIGFHDTVFIIYFIIKILLNGIPIGNSYIYKLLLVWLLCYPLSRNKTKISYWCQKKKNVDNEKYTGNRRTPLFQGFRTSFDRLNKYLIFFCRWSQILSFHFLQHHNHGHIIG